MNIPDIHHLAEQAVHLLRPEALVLAGKMAESAASETGKQLLTWAKSKFSADPAAQTALQAAEAKPEDDRRWQALQLQLEMLLEDHEVLREEMAALLAAAPAPSISGNQANFTGDGNKTAQATGKGHQINIS